MRKNNLRMLRKRLGFSQVGLAEAAHCSRATIIIVERLNHYPTAGVRSRLATALGVSETTLWPQLKASLETTEGEDGD